MTEDQNTRAPVVSSRAGEIERLHQMLINREEFIASKGLWKEFSVYLAEPSPSPAPGGVGDRCATICDKHALWLESKIEGDPRSPNNQAWSAASNTANDLAEMIRKDLRSMDSKS